MNERGHAGAIGALSLSICAAILWCQAALSENTIKDSGAREHVGEYCAVKGVVADVYTSRKGNTFLNFGKPYPDQIFTAVVFRSDAYRFDNLHQWEGRTLIVRGLIKLYRGKPEIILKDPAQLSAAE